MERAVGSRLLAPQRQPSDYFPPKLTMTLTTAGYGKYLAANPPPPPFFFSFLLRCHKSANYRQAVTLNAPRFSVSPGPAEYISRKKTRTPDKEI